MESRIFLVLLVFLIVVDHSTGRRRNMCRRGMRMCHSVRLCYPEYKRCDGSVDCHDYSDEYNCPGFTCPGGKFHCGNGPCINPNWECDNYRDCTDGSDEANCPPRPGFTCPGGKFHCGNGTCINPNWECDSYRDCTDGSDEANCPHK